eukprot:COSAG01_NODE_2307_length_7944_cov_31.370045_4_plen_111_part_00
MGKWDKGGSSGTHGGGWAATLEAQLQAMEPRELLLTVALGVLSLGLLGWLFGMCGGGQEGGGPRVCHTGRRARAGLRQEEEEEETIEEGGLAPLRGVWAGASMCGCVAAS